MCAKLRKVTSAIEDMTVTEVRQDLLALRRYYTCCVRNMVDIDLDYMLHTKKHTIGMFCLKFVQGHHMKRHKKSQTYKSSTC